MSTESEIASDNPSQRQNYTEFEGGFNQIILEESFVLNLKTTMSFVDFKMSFAVNENYPLYTPPEIRHNSDNHSTDSSDDDHLWDTACSSEEEDEEVALELSSSETDSTEMTPAEAKEPNHVYRTGRLFFPNMEQVRWQSRIQPYIDPATGSVDYGAIDYFYRQDGCYYLAGFWGELEVVSAPPILEIDELKEWTQTQKEKSLNS